MFNRDLYYNYFLHIINGIIPFLIITILSHKISIEYLGKYFYAFSIISITQLFVDYSFSFSALREYKNLRENFSNTYERISLFINIVLSKILISIIILILYFILKNYFSILKTENILLYIFFGIFLSITNFNWFFYVTHKSHYNSILLFILRILFLIPLLFKIPLIASIFFTFFPVFLANVLLLLFLLFKYKIDYNNYKFQLQIGRRFYEGKSMFLNSIVISLFVNSWPLFFKVYLTNSEIGIFGIADRIVKGMMSLITPIPNFILTHNKKFSFINFKISNSYFGLFFFIFPLIFVLIPNSLLVHIIGKSAISSRSILNFYSIGFVSGCINLLLYTFLIYHKREVEYTFCFIIAIILIISNIFLTEFSIFTPLYFDIILAILMLINFFITYKKIKLNHMKNNTLNIFI